MDKEKEKEIEAKVEQHFADNLLNYLVGKTFARHSKLTEEEFLKEIGFDGSGKSENEAFRIAIYNLLVASTTELIKAKQSLRNANELLKAYFEENKGE